MSQLFETIKCVDGKLHNLEFHQERFNRSRKNYFGSDDLILIEESISIPDEFKKGVFRCRITYTKKIEKVEFIPYQFRKVDSLKLVYDDSVDYRFKYTDREHITRLYEKREQCDDILIVKNNCITDSSTANPIFFDGTNWFTPDTVLLRGTQRSRLLREGKIAERRITLDDLNKFSKIGLINALQPMENMPVIDIRKVKR